MKVSIIEAVELALKATVPVLGNELYERQYRSSHFDPILSEYNKLNERYYDDDIIEKDYELFKTQPLYNNFSIDHLLQVNLLL